MVPNLAGIQLLGRQEALQKAIPIHQVNFQVLDAHGDVKVNDLLDAPLIKTIQEVETSFLARNHRGYDLPAYP